MTQLEVPISLTAFGCAPRPATAHVIEQSTAERVGRAFAGLAMFWALALLGLFKAGGRFASGRSFDCPACHGLLTLVTPERPT